MKRSNLDMLIECSPVPTLDRHIRPGFEKNRFQKTSFEKNGFEKPVSKKPVSKNRFRKTGFEKTGSEKTGFGKNRSPIRKKTVAENREKNDPVFEQNWMKKFFFRCGWSRKVVPRHSAQRHSAEWLHNYENTVFSKRLSWVSFMISIMYDKYFHLFCGLYYKHIVVKNE
jgi:hypothetical protein